MPRPLVIVESPAKAKTIARHLGGGYDVRASVGHIADLPTKGLGVDVEHGFAPQWELTARGKDVVKELKALLKDASELYLATDEDREGEIISWHLLQHLKPKVPVRRMVFHEITQSAISDAVAHPRDLDEGLVDAAETRRILDRLYGWEVSPVLWRRVNRGLAAGRVQSPATRLVVERERQRMAFVPASYWDLEALVATDPSFSATLVGLDGTKVATGKDFGDDGVPHGAVVVLDEARARSLADGLAGRDLEVRSVEEKPYRSTPKPPFMTSTLQQEGGRKLRLSAQQVMRLAQGLYERGFITYMRTDSVTLSQEAMSAVRATVASTYGDRFLSATPRQFATKVKNAQEAHEAIRPSTPLRSPDQVASDLHGPELGLYRLIWQRTLASQMADATGTTVSVRLGAIASDGAGPGTDCEFAASGTTITFPGYRQAYVESTDDAADADAAEREALLPALTVGQLVPVESITPNGHTTTSPARYTEASLIKRLEELGIGRPSTWANIIQTILDRGYVWKKGQALVPTWTAFAVVRLLEQHFDELVDYAFTARLEDDLDAIALGDEDKVTWLKDFYFGAEHPPGLKHLVEENLDKIDAARDQHVPPRLRRRRRGDRREAGQVRAVREAGRRHRQRARDHDARRADGGRGADAAGRAQERRPDRAPRRAARVRQERPLRTLRPVGRGRRAAAGHGQAEDVVAVQDHDAGAHDHRAGHRAARAAPHRRHRPGGRAGGGGRQRPLRPLREQGQGDPVHRHGGAAAHHHLGRGAGCAGPAPAVPGSRQRRAEAAAARVSGPIR